MKISEDAEHDMFAARFNSQKTDYCEEYTTENGQQFIIDIDKKGRVCGIEIFDFRGFKKE